MGSSVDALDASAPSAPSFFVAHHRALVNASRTMLIMLLIAGLAVLALGLAAVLIGDPPETGGWLREIFGRVFAVVAAGLAAVLGIPAAIGLYAMAGSTAAGAVPAMPKWARRGAVAIALATVAVAVIVCLATGSALAILNLGLIGLVTLSSLGLAGASAFSIHRWRATASAIALMLVSAGSLWVLGRAFLGTPAA
jgi:hypothetical protein